MLATPENWPRLASPGRQVVFELFCKFHWLTCWQRVGLLAISHPRPFAPEEEEKEEEEGAEKEEDKEGDKEGVEQMGEALGSKSMSAVR